MHTLCLLLIAFALWAICHEIRACRRYFLEFRNLVAKVARDYGYHAGVYTKAADSENQTQDDSEETQ